MAEVIVSWSRLRSRMADRPLPLAQGVAGSNPVAPTTFRVPGFQRVHTIAGCPGVILRPSTIAQIRRYN